MTYKHTPAHNLSNARNHSRQLCDMVCTLSGNPRKVRADDFAESLNALQPVVDEFPRMVTAMRRFIAGGATLGASMDEMGAILSRIDGAGEALPQAPEPAPTASARDDLPALLSDMGAFLSGFDGCEFNGEAVESLQARIAAQVGER